MEYNNTQKIKRAMHNITINIPNLYDENIQKLIGMKLIASRSEAIRIALREFLNREFGENLELLGYSVKKEEKEKKSE
ncbi:MAG: ribbon-helix-helix domain-containing protein [Promethearchaeota archaeon]